MVESGFLIKVIGGAKFLKSKGVCGLFYVFVGMSWWLFGGGGGFESRNK